MDFIQQLISDQIINALGWTVIHSIWQGLLLAIILYFLLYLFRNKSAQWKYLLANVFLMGIFGMAIGTFIFLYKQSEPLVIQQADRLIMVYQPLEWSGSQFAGTHNILKPIDLFLAYLSDHIALITTFWMIGLLFFGARLAGGLIYVQHIKLGARLPNFDHWQHILDEMALRLNISYPVILLESSKIYMPLTVGFIKPVILFPLGMVNRLPIEQIEAILAHELAHIYRYDYLSNIIQSMIETVLYFNPSVWWISAIIRKERENRCDDLAVELCGNSLTYAKALVSLQDRHESSPTLAMALSKNKNVLLNRIRRILKQPQKNSSTMEKFIASCLLLSFVIVFSLGAKSPKAEEIHTKTEVVAPTPDSESTELFFPEPKKVVFTPVDTLPKGKMTINVTQNDSTVHVRIQNRKIDFLKINGLQIPESEFPKYEELVEDIIRDLPEPPAPINPIEPIEPMAPPAPPAPSAVPMPPAPPAPPAPKMGTKIRTEKDAEGNTIIYLEEGDLSQPLEVIVQDGDDVTINGETIKPGESTIIYDDGEYTFGEEPNFFRKGNGSIWISPGNENAIFFNSTSDENFQGIVKGQFFESLDSLQAKAFYYHSKFDTVPKDLSRYFKEYQKSMELLDESRMEELRKIEKELHQRQLKLSEYLAPYGEKLQMEKDLIQKQFREAEKLLNDYEHGGVIDRLNELRSLEIHNMDSLRSHYQNWSDASHIMLRDGEYSFGGRALDFSLFEKELIKDRLVQPGERYKMDLSDGHLKINGKALSGELHEKYLKMAEEMTGQDPKDEGYNLSIQKKARERTNRRAN